MLISFKNTVLLPVLAIVLNLPGVMAEDTWTSAERKRRSKVEQDVLAEAAKRRQAEEARWGKSADTKQTITVKADRNAELEKMKAEVAAARARAEAAEKAKAEAERTSAVLEEALKASKSETVSERTRAEAAEKAIADVEKSRNRAESSLEAAKAQMASKESRIQAAEKARGEAERNKAQAEAERDKAKAEAERSRARAGEYADQAKPARQDDSSGESVWAKVGRKILWYIPNRLSDLMDVFTVEVGAGELGVDLQLTRHLTLGAGVGYSHMLGWSIFNQHGIYKQQGWYADFLRLRAADLRREQVCGAYTPFAKYNRGSVDINEMSSEKAEDPYAVGVRLGCYLNLKFQIHVTELADFVAGIFFIDFKDDDREKFNWVF